MPWSKCAGLALLMVGGLLQAQPRLISGELKALEAEGIFVPHSNSSPVVLRYLAPEGQWVEPGDVLVRIDPGAAASQVEQLRSQLSVLEATVAKDLAALEVAAVDAELAARQAAATLAKAKIDAAVPAQFRSKLDFDRMQGEHLRAEQEAALKKVEWDNALEAVSRKRADSKIELERLRTDLNNAERDVARAEGRARTRGRVLFGFDPWQGRRYQEGATAYPGNRVGDVIGSAKLDVVAYALEPDRVGLAVGDSVDLRLDALPDAQLEGRVQRISGAPEPRSQWGEGRYFTIDISIESEVSELPLLPGMSVQVATRPSTAPPAEAP